MQPEARWREGSRPLTQAVFSKITQRPLTRTRHAVVDGGYGQTVRRAGAGQGGRGCQEVRTVQTPSCAGARQAWTNETS
jgi:hypothetical protein